MTTQPDKKEPREIKCPKCKSINLLTERRPLGDSQCLDCNYRAMTFNFLLVTEVATNKKVPRGSKVRLANKLDKLGLDTFDEDGMINESLVDRIIDSVRTSLDECGAWSDEEIRSASKAHENRTEELISALDQAESLQLRLTKAEAMIEVMEEGLKCACGIKPFKQTAYEALQQLQEYKK